MRVAFLAAEAIPFLRRYSIAFSMSAAHSESAFLQSAMPAPVRSRRSLIICAVMSAMSILLVLVCRTGGETVGSAPSVGRLAAARFVLGGRGRFWRGQVAAPPRDDLDARSFATRRNANRLLLLAALFLARRP